MALELGAEPVPLRADPSGVLRVGGTRVTLDTVVGAFDGGASAEEIVLRYDSLRLQDVYLVLGYCLAHRNEVDAYLAGRRRRGESSQAAAEAKLPWAEVRARLVARRDSMSASPRDG